MWRDALRALYLAPRIERLRAGGPKAALAEARRRGRAARTRDGEGREKLRRVIAAVDRRAPGGANCYRRVLLEVAMDAGAASEAVHLGFRLEDPVNPGHAWLGDLAGEQEPFDTVLDL